MICVRALLGPAPPPLRSGRRSAEGERIMQQIMSREWGLILLDEASGEGCAGWGEGGQEGRLPGCGGRAPGLLGGLTYSTQRGPCLAPSHA